MGHRLNLVAAVERAQLAAREELMRQFDAREDANSRTCRVCGGKVRSDNSSGVCRGCARGHKGPTACACGCGAYLDPRYASRYRRECAIRLSRAGVEEGVP